MSTMQFGWVNWPKGVEQTLNRCRHPLFSRAAGGLKEDGKGKVVLLYDTVKRVTGQWWTNNQTIGDCVSHGMAGAVRTLTCVEIALYGEREKWVADVATEPIYAGSRVEVGKGQLGSGDGSLGSWAAEWVRDWGILLRQRYGEYDLTTYSGSKAKEWGMPRAGCPDILEPIAREHPVRTISLVTSYEQARDAIANGYPITVASMQGFNTTRDSEGFLSPSGQWAHQMFISAVDDEYKRPGCLIENSWGTSWVNGPTRLNQPPGSFWVDADVVDGMLRQDDSWAISQFEGFPSQDLDHMLI